MADLTAAQQLDAVMKQLDAAKRRLPLASIGAELHPPDMLRRPENNLGAELRTAYWLAVAARPTAGRAADSSLLSAASAAAATAQWHYGALSGRDPLAMLTALPGVLLNPLGTDHGQVDQILYRGEQAAARRGRADIAGILNGLRAAAPPQSTGIGGLLDPRDEHTGARAVWLSGGVLAAAVVGVGLFFAWPYLPTIGKAAARGAGTAYASYREHRQKRA